jgi:GNAT superfamily N-acetyltransferase
VVEIAGAVVAFGGAGSPFSHTVGLGMSGPVTADDLDRIEQFYRERNSPPAIDVCPLADPSLQEQIGKREYRIAEFNNVLVRTVDASLMHGEACARVAAREECDLWMRTIFRGFFEREEMTTAEAELTAILFQAPLSVPWLTTVEGRPAGAAAMAIHNGLALLYGDAVLPAYRQRGLHSALIQARLAYAAERGCDLATASTFPGARSQRNYERLGFRVVYTKLIAVRD